MAQVLFIKIQDLKKNTVIDGNVDVDKLLPYVKIAQEINAQSIDQSKLVPLLVKTIQELEARITALEG